jgi:hypothetical protein
MGRTREGPARRALTARFHHPPALITWLLVTIVSLHHQSLDKAGSRLLLGTRSSLHFVISRVATHVNLFRHQRLRRPITKRCGRGIFGGAAPR